MTIDGYSVTVRSIGDDIGGGYLAFVADLPGCMADGETQDEALAACEEAVAAWIDTAQALGREIPAPASAEVRRLA